jgi:hypothetical protein
VNASRIARLQRFAFIANWISLKVALKMSQKKVAGHENKSVARNVTILPQNPKPTTNGKPERRVGCDEKMRGSDKNNGNQNQSI